MSYFDCPILSKALFCINIMPFSESVCLKHTLKLTLKLTSKLTLKYGFM